MKPSDTRREDCLLDRRPGKQSEGLEYRAELTVGGRQRSGRVRIVVGYAISAICIALLWKYVDWEELVAAFRQADFLPLVAGTAMVCLCYGVFALRWRLLLTNKPGLPLGTVFSILMMGYLTNLLLPLRPGDILRAVLVDRAFDYGTMRALSSIVLERLLDVVALLLCGLAVFALVDVPRALGEALVSLTLMGLVIFLGIAALVWSTKPLAYLSEVSPAAFKRFLDAAVRAVTDFGESLKHLAEDNRSSRIRLLAIGALSGVGWSMFAGAMVACVMAVRPETPIGAGIALAVVTNLGAAIPSSPAGIGVYHALGVVTLNGWGVPIGDALAIATVSHALVVGTQAALALGSQGTQASMKGFRFGKFRRTLWDHEAE
ncbi:MAG: lysylphosphatidylglycerol synthase transmembrane domain-containing protein [Chromatiales bacterium]